MSRMAATRDGYGQGLLNISGDERVVVLEADLGKSTKSLHFRNQFPERTVSLPIDALADFIKWAVTAHFTADAAWG